MEKNPGTPDIMVERAVRCLLKEVIPAKKPEKVYPFRFLTQLSFSKTRKFLVARRKQILAWSLVLVLFLLFGAR